MTDNAQALIREIETAQQALQENLQEIYHRVHPKNILKKLSISLKSIIASPAFIGVITIISSLVIASVALNRRRTHHLLETQKNAQKALEAYQVLQSEYND